MKGGPAQLRLYQELLKNLINNSDAKPSFNFNKEFKTKDGGQEFPVFLKHKLVRLYSDFRMGIQQERQEIRDARSC